MKMNFGSSSTFNDGDTWWWEPDAESLLFDFCRDTSLHGLKYINQPQRHLSERIFWSVSFATGLGFAVYLIFGIWQNYHNNPIIVAFEPFETTSENIPFPAITICNMNKILKSKADEITAKVQVDGKEIYQDISREDSDNVFQLAHICGVSAGFSKFFNISKDQEKVDSSGLKDNNTDTIDIQKFLQNNSQKCSDMIPLCMWEDQEANCSVLFKAIETDFGKCCTFNMVSESLLHLHGNDTRDSQEEIDEWSKWDLERDGILFPSSDLKDVYTTRRKFPLRQTRAGKNFGLSILLNPNLKEYFCTTSDSQGFRLAAHFSVEVPHVGDFGIGIGPDTEVFVNVKPQITIAEENIKGFTLDKRRCYFPKDHQLKFYNYYTTTNCIDECISEETYKNCSCVRYYMPRQDNWTLCGPTKFNCAERIKREYITQGLRNKCSNCLRTCTELQYFIDSTTTPLVYQDTDWEFKNGSFAKWAKENVSIVHVFMDQASTYARVRKQLYTGVDLIARSGGLMGLCLGFSGLSLMEVIYYFTLRAWWRHKKKLENGDSAGSGGSSIFHTMVNAWSKNKSFVHQPMMNEIAPYFKTHFDARRVQTDYRKW